MNYLSLFSGACGGDLAFQHLLEGFKCIGYIEIDDYCQRVILQRIKDGLLDAAPIFGDIRGFIKEGFAESYKGMVDVITAGFPCQPFSVAGKRKGEQDERNLWPATRDTIRIIRPRFVFLENVPGLLNSGYFGTILCDLSEIGYNAKWTVLGADDVGARHKRKRLWILAYPSCE
jgi:DNA (cytosine-5)-methyltransferase 1